jgi:hypothetical protein
MANINGRSYGASTVLGAGEAHLGEVSNWHAALSVLPTLDTNPYAAGDAVGGVQLLSFAARVANNFTELQSLVVVDKSNNKSALTIIFFDFSPSAATITNNQPFVLSTAAGFVAGVVSVATGDYVTDTAADAKAVAAKANIGLQMRAQTNADLYAAVILAAGTPTYALGDLRFIYNFKQ